MPWTPLQTWPPIDSYAALVTELKERLGYCECASPGAVRFLRDILHIVANRSNAIADQAIERVQLAQQNLGDRLRESGAPEMQSWFIHALEKADLVFHNFNRNDLLIADRGQWLLHGLEQFSDPPSEGRSDLG